MVNSPQHDIIDELIWSRVSDFWSNTMDVSDREALTTAYEAFLKAMDSEYVRLAQINDAKSIDTCPIYSQRRWLRLDLNRYDELQAWLLFLQAGLNASTLSGEVANPLTSAGSASSVACILPTTVHSKHWHIHFPFVVDAVLPDPDRRTINLHYPTALGLVDIFRMSTDGQGRRTANRLLPDRDYSILADGTSVRITQALPGDVFEVSAAMDLSGTEYDDVRPLVYQVSSVLGPNIVASPPEMDTGHPVHALIIRNPPPGSENGLASTNNSSFTSEREFYQYTGNASTGVQRAGFGQVALPAGVVIGPTDLVFLFSTEVGEFDTLHTHSRISFFLDSQTADASGTVGFTPPLAVARGIFGSIDGFGQGLKLYFDGRLVSPTEYNYEAASNLFTLKTPLTFTSSVKVEILFTEENRADPTTLDTLHVHYTCSAQSAIVAEEFLPFDDGGTFDDDTDPNPYFDSLQALNVLYLDLSVELETLDVYIDGVLLRIGTDYSATLQEDGRTRLGFSFDIGGKSVQTVFEAASALYSYGATGAGAGYYGFTADSLSGILNDLQNVLPAFEAQLGHPIQNLAALIDAAYIAAAGGDPLLTLFYDEFPEYKDLPIDSPNASITAANARNVESQDTRLVDIPFLVDHVKNPTVRLEAGLNYTVENGVLQSGNDLTAPRGDDDDAPGVWWCPIVILDEQFLAKNYGALLGDIQESSPAYRDSLKANLHLRFTGPTQVNIRNAAAVMLGSEAFTQDARITDIRAQRTGWTLTVTSTQGTQIQAVSLEDTGAILPTVGDPVVPGQSILSPLVYNKSLHNMSNWDGQSIVILDTIVGAAKGDRVRLQLYDPNDITADPVWHLFTIAGIATEPIPGGTQTRIGLDRASTLTVLTSSIIQIFRDIGAPYAAFEGSVSDISPVQDRIIETEQETFTLAPEAPLSYRIGDEVHRGDPVRPDLATLYSHQTRPDWYLIKHSEVSRDWEHLIAHDTRTLRTDGLPDVRTVSISPGESGFAVATMSPALPLPPRGTEVVVDAVDSTTSDKFVVSGINGTDVLLLPNADRVITGSALLALPGSAAAIRRDHFEVPVARVGSVRPTTALAFDHQARVSSLLVESAANFPDQGLLTIQPPQGGSIEVEYFARNDTKLFDLIWPTDIPCLVDSSGTYDPLLLKGAVVTSVYDYQPSLLNPAFISLVETRVARDYGTPSGAPVIDDSTAPQYYELLKNSSAVLRTRSVSRPEALRDVLEEALPPGTTLLMLSQHVVADEYISQSTDGLFASDLVKTFHPIQIVISSPDGIVGDITPNTLHLPLATVAFVLESAITDPDTSEPVEYAWGIRVRRGTSENLALLDPTGASTRITGVEANTVYDVTLTVRNVLGQEQTQSLTVLVDS